MIFEIKLHSKARIWPSILVLCVKIFCRESAMVCKAVASCCKQTRPLLDKKLSELLDKKLDPLQRTLGSLLDKKLDPLQRTLGSQQRTLGSLQRSVGSLVETYMPNDAKIMFGNALAKPFLIRSLHDAVHLIAKASFKN